MKIGNIEVHGIIYKITNLINGKVYIGKTIQGFNLRYCEKGKGIERVYKRHKMLKENGYGYNKHLLESIEKHGFNNFKVDECIDIAFSDYELSIKEKCWVQYYDSYKHGYNNTIGGDGVSGFEGIKGKDNPTSRSVIQLDLEGNFIKQWDCMSDAEKYTGVNKSKITVVCKKQRRSAGNYIWVYTEEYNKNEDYSYKPYIPDTKKVIQLDLNGNFIKEWISGQQASKELNLKTSNISRCCRHERKSYENYIWIFKDEYDPNKNYKYNAKSEGKAKKVLAFDKHMNFIKEFESIAKTSKHFGYSETSIRNQLYHKSNKITEHIFIFKDEYEKQFKNNIIQYKMPTTTERVDSIYDGDATV